MTCRAISNTAGDWAFLKLLGLFERIDRLSIFESCSFPMYVDCPMLEPVGPLCITDILTFNPLVAPFYGNDFPTEYRRSLPSYDADWRPSAHATPRSHTGFPSSYLGKRS